MRLLRRSRDQSSNRVARDGTRLRDRFELLMPLGSGGFGTVWEGFDMLLERPVAIKQIDLRTRNAAAADLALREARATARLNHPAIVSLYEVVQAGDSLYLVSELVRGHTLAALIDEDLLADRDVAEIGEALCAALGHAHGAGVVHRDVKPANVMVPQEWCEQVAGWRSQPAKLMDFGIASVRDTHGGDRGLAAGSRHYVAPEQAAGKPVSPAADVYSLGALLFECFTGCPRQFGRRGADWLAHRRPDLPAALTATIDRCFDDDPTFRPALADLAGDLATAAPDLSDSLERPGRFARAIARASRPRFGSSSSVAARCATAVMLAALAALIGGAVGGTVPLWPVGAAAALGFAAPVAAPIVFVIAATVALTIAGMPGAALLAAATSGLGVLTLVPRFNAAARGALCAAWLAICGALAGHALLLAPPPGLPDTTAMRDQAAAGVTALAVLVEPAVLATVGLWVVAAHLWTWVVAGPERLGMTLRACIWAAATAVGQLTIAIAFGVGVGGWALAAIVTVLAAAGGAGVARRRGGRVVAGPRDVAIP